LFAVYISHIHQLFFRNIKEINMTTRISTLPSLATVTAATILPVVESGATKRVTAAALATYITGTVVASSVPGGSSSHVQYNSSGAFAGSSNLVWDNTNGRLGIGTASPAQPLNIKGSGTQTLWLESTDTQKAILAISASDTSVALQSTYNTGGSAARPFIFYNVSTALMTFDVNKTVALQGATSSAGIGIGFPATQSASSDANTLDDYEEGTWTPVLVGSTSGAYSNTNYNTGKYVKIGKYVWIELEVGCANSFQPVGDLTITGLPFTSVNYYNCRYPLAVDLSYVTFDNTKRWSANVRVNSTVIDIIQNVSAGASTPVTGANLANTNSSQRYMGFYEVA
jgi:hypothetical protein